MGLVDGHRSLQPHGSPVLCSGWVLAARLSVRLWCEQAGPARALCADTEPRL